MNRGSSQVNLPIGDPRHASGRMNEVLNHEYVNFAKMNGGGAGAHQPIQMMDPNAQLPSQQFLPPIQRGWSGNLRNLSPGHAAGMRKMAANGVGNALAYDSDATNLTAPTMQGPPSSYNRLQEQGGYPGGVAGYNNLDGQSQSLDSYAIVPLESKGQISLSRDGPSLNRGFNAAMSLRPTSNLSPLRAVGGLAPSADQMDIQVKLRQLEMNLLDYKGTVDRKILNISEELPQQIKREVKSFELKEEQLLRDVANKFQNMQETSIRTRDSLKHRQTELTDQLQKIEVKGSEMEYRISQALKQIEVHSQMMSQYASVAQGGQPPSSALVPQGGIGGQGGDALVNSTQLAFLRDQLADERQKREQQVSEFQRSQASIQEKMRNLEVDLSNKVKEQRESQMRVVSTFDEEKTRLIKNGGNTAEESKNMISSLLGAIERKVEEEVTSRQRDLGETKDALEQKLIGVLDKIKTDERQSLERERRLMEQVQDGLNTMNEIIKGTKEQNTVNLTHNATIMTEQIGSQNSELEQVKSYVFGRQGAIESEVADQKQRLLDLEEATLKHVNNVNSVVETEMSRFEKVISAIETHLVGGIENLKKENEDFRMDSGKWRVDYEDMQAKKLQEVHEAIKELNSQIGKGANDWRDRCDQVSADTQLLENAIQSQIADLKETILEGDKNMDERNQVFSNRLQEKVKAQVDESLSELRNRFNQNLELIQGKFKENNVQIRAYIEKSSEASMSVLKEAREEQNTLLEGRAQAFTVQSEQKLVAKINSLYGRYETLQDQFNRGNNQFRGSPEHGGVRSSQASAQPVKEGSPSEIVMEQERMQMQKEAVEREQAIRKWTVSRIKDNYDDFDRLLTAKLAEINAKLAVGGGGGGNVNANASSGNNQQQARFERLESLQREMRDELQDKVSFAMVQSMIGQAQVDNGSGGGRLSNFKSDNNILNQVPGVADEDSVGKHTEDFGGYTFDEHANSKGVAYEPRIEDSVGLEGSAIKQRAALNINHSATPIHLSQGSIQQIDPIDLNEDGPNGEPDRSRTGLISASKAQDRSPLGGPKKNRDESAASVSYGQSQFEEL